VTPHTHGKGDSSGHQTGGARHVAVVGRHVAVAGAATAPVPATLPRWRHLQGLAFPGRGEAQPPRGARRARGGAARALDAGARDGGAAAGAEARGLGALPPRSCARHRLERRLRRRGGRRARVLRRGEARQAAPPLARRLRRAVPGPRRARLLRHPPRPRPRAWLRLGHGVRRRRRGLRGGQLGQRARRWPNGSTEE
jgi:hypothetical protein